VLSDGVLEFKRKWGAHVRRVRQDGLSGDPLSGRGRRALRSLVARHPLITRRRTASSSCARHARPSWSRRRKQRGECSSSVGWRARSYRRRTAA
jgi:hypothetical protein